MNISNKASGSLSPDRSGANRWEWLVTICGGIVFGVLLGVLLKSGILFRFHLGPLIGAISAGVVVALLAAILSAKRLVSRTLVANVFVTVFCIATMVFYCWPSVHWPVASDLFIIMRFFFFICVPGTLLSVIIAAVRRRRA